jgi:predicted permease
MRFALRRLLRAPRFAGFCVLMLGISVGVGTALYSLIYATLYRPATLPNLDRLASVYHTDPRERGGVPSIALSWPDFEDLSAHRRTFQGLAGYTEFQLPLIIGKRARSARGEAVTQEYFSVIGLTPRAGRFLGPSDHRPGAQPLAVISERLWRAELANASDLTGATLVLGGVTFDIIGVVPEGYQGVSSGDLLPADVWIPARAAAGFLNKDIADRQDRWLFVLGLLRSPSEMAEARTHVTYVADALDASAPLERPISAGDPRTIRQWVTIPTSEIRFHGQDTRFFRPLGRIIVVSVLIVLLVACTNLANLTLARQAERRGELAVKLALGASRGTLVREQLMEGILLAGAGGVVAILVASVLIATLQSDVAFSNDLLLTFRPTLEPAVFAAAAAATGFSLLAFSLVPALRAGQVVPRESMQSETGTAVTVRWRSRKWLIIGQVAASALFLILAAQAAVHVQRIQKSELQGLDEMAVVRLVATDGTLEARRIRNLTLALSQTGFQSATASSGIPGLRAGRTVFVYPTADGPGLPVEQFRSSPGLPLVLGASLLRGRWLNEWLATNTECVLSQSVATRSLESSDVIGRSIQVTSDGLRRACTIVGVVEDLGPRRQATIGAIYLPLTEGLDERQIFILARTKGAQQRAGQLAMDISGIDSGVAVLSFGTARDMAGTQTIVLRVATTLALALGALALALTLFGLYGVMSQIVVARTREVGLRLALGGSHYQVCSMMLRQALEPIVVGALLGAVLAVLGVRSFAQDGVALGFVSFVVPPMLVISVSLLACLLPLRRLLFVSPAASLRSL